MLTMMDDSGSKPFELIPRHILSDLLKTLHQRNQFPVMAIELEFYLLDKKRDRNGKLQGPVNPVKNQREITAMYIILIALMITRPFCRM